MTLFNWICLWLVAVSIVIALAAAVIGWKGAGVVAIIIALAYGVAYSWAGA